ncbi:MAG TPA: thioredoxin domain-containing protein, partial [Candidatus Acidoferrum sp.]|nr:thioredoxin domain-containing protein [Candidatus Acidoferrum sp.]
MTGNRGKPNHLIKEKSPYLLQHAHNPVDWYPWSDEAFEKAKREGKPVFLSIGYSTCHWCHVMKRESFEDEQVASLLNEKFVCVKVDREERPDVDSIYMKVCQLLTGSGGWPLTIIMTAEERPFFAGTYFPRDSTYGRIGLMDLLQKVSDLWQKDRQKLLEEAMNITMNLTTLSEMKSNGENLTEGVLDEAFIGLADSFDEVNGGFGSRPKFPTPHNLLFLLRYWKRRKNQKALSMVEKTLQKMRLGGIFDQIGFGFHRYSTDSSWLVPHFEKMLYDQALISLAYTEAYQATGKNEYRLTAEEILQYVLTSLTHREGAFLSAEDAESEDEEGRFYLWTETEVKEELGDASSLFGKVFNIHLEGNYVDELLQKRTGKNILYLKKPIGELASELGMNPKELREKL